MLMDTMISSLLLNSMLSLIERSIDLQQVVFINTTWIKLYAVAMMCVFMCLLVRC